MGLNKSFLNPYSRKANYLDCVERSCTKCPEPLDRMHKKKGKHFPLQPPPPWVLLLYPTRLCNWRSLIMKHLLSFSIERAILKRMEHFIKLFTYGLCESILSLAAWIAFCLNLAQLYLTAKGAKSSGVFRHTCDVIPYAVMIYLLCDVVCICPSVLVGHSYRCLDQWHIFFYFFFFTRAMFCFTLRAQTALARTRL